MSRARWITGALGLAILAVAFAPPFVDGTARTLVMQAFSAVCHQIPSRSATIDGVPLAACDRCMGIYFGLPLAALLFTLLARVLGDLGRRAPIALAASVFPIALDWTLDALGILENTVPSRWVTGLVFGLVAGYFLVAAVGDLVRPRRRLPGKPSN